MEIGKDDWRLQGQEKYLKGASLSFKEYAPYKKNCDHDHCEFCGSKFSLVVADALRSGYATFDNYHWICSDCYSDFKAMFGW